MITDYHTLTGHCIEYPVLLVNVVNTCTEHLVWPTLTGQCDINDIIHTLTNCYWSMYVETKKISLFRYSYISMCHSGIFRVFFRLKMKDETLLYESFIFYHIIL